MRKTGCPVGFFGLGTPLKKSLTFVKLNNMLDRSLENLQHIHVHHRLPQLPLQRSPCLVHITVTHV